MNKTKLVASILGAAALGSLVASPASAGICSTRIRNIPANGESATIFCRRNSGAATNGVLLVTVRDGVKTFSANLQTGNVITIRGMTADGVGIPGCTFKDDAPGGTPVSGTCNSAVKWQGTVNFTE